MKRIDCVQIAKEKKEEITNFYRGKKTPTIGIAVVGSETASRIYVNKKIKEAKEMCFKTALFPFKETISYEELKQNLEEISLLCDGVMLQLPLPNHLKPYEDDLLSTIPANKDIDGLNKENLYNLTLGLDKETILPATVKGILTILDKIGEGDLTGKDIVVIGRGKTVGKPIISALSNRNATVTWCHSKTKKLVEKTKNADIIISAVGIPNFLNNIGNENTILVDVGISRDENNKIKGDFHPDCYDKCRRYTSTPGGTGVMTVISLLENLHILYQRNLNETTNR